MKSISGIESRWGKLTKSRLNNEWRRKHYINSRSDEIKYVLFHSDDPSRQPLLQAVIKRKKVEGHSTHSSTWDSIKLSDIEPYIEDDWEGVLRNELNALGTEMSRLHNEDRKLIEEGVRSKISDFISVSEEGRREMREVAWKIANIQANGLGHSE